MNRLEKKLKYVFCNKTLLKTALTHSSYANEHKQPQQNERLEFLGDSVLSVIMADYLYRSLPDMPEGELTKLRASLVCEGTLCTLAKSLLLGELLLLGRGEEITGGREKPSVLADAFEALLGAVYLDSSLDKVREIVLPMMRPFLEEPSKRSFKDYKTQLQEIVQKNPGEMLSYRLAGESGPDHLKMFDVELFINSNLFARGQGHSKKTAEQDAARQALELMGIQ